jgi:hypothetical protein
LATALLLTAFRLWAGAAAGSAQLFLHAKQGDVVQDPAVQAIIGELSGGADVPLGQRFGVLVKVSLADPGPVQQSV